MDMKFARLDFLRASSGRTLLPRPPSPNEALVSHFSALLRRELLDSPEQVRCAIKLEQTPALKLTWIAAGHTAGIAYWLRDHSVEAISLVLSGIDPIEDLAAMQIVTCATPDALPRQASDSILAAPHPLLVCLYSEPDVVRDMTISTAAVALAIAFFGMFGVTNERESRSC